jgi:outer membrane protein assembly factor BamE
LSLSFKNEVLERVSGDELPSEAEFVTKLVPVKTAPKQIELQAKEEDLLKFPAPVRQPSPAAPAAPLPSTYPPLEPAKP